jgi:hypothetical protein
MNLYNTKQAAKIIGINPTTMAHWCLRGIAASVKIGRAYAISEKEVQRLKAWYAQRQESGSKFTPFEINKTFKITGNATDRTNDKGEVYTPPIRHGSATCRAKNNPAPSAWTEGLKSARSFGAAARKHNER